MQDKGSVQANKTIRWKRFLLLLVLSPFILWLVSNLWLVSPWGRGFVEKKLTQKSGLEWRVSGSWWTPWGGVSLWGLELYVAKDSEALVKLPETQVQLYWRDLLQRKVNLQQIDVEQPVIRVDLDELKQWLEQQPATEWVPQEAPQLAMDPDSVLPKNTVPPQETKPAIEQNSSEVSDPKTTAKTQQKETAATLIKKTHIRPLIMVIKGARINVEQDGKKLFDVDGIDLRLPIIGTETEGELKVKSVSVLSKVLVENLTLPIQRYGVVVGVVQKDISPHGVSLSWTAQMNLQSKVFRLLLAIPQQEVFIDLGEKKIMAVKSASVRAELVGKLSQLSTWNGGAIASLHGLNVGDSSGEILFTQGELRAFCRSGNIRIPSISLVSEDLSLLGNGFMRNNGFVCGVIRLIGSPEAAVSVHQRIQPTESINDWWRDYESPDRKYRDVQLEGDLGNWKILDMEKWFSAKEWLSVLTKSPTKQ